MCKTVKEDSRPTKSTDKTAIPAISCYTCNTCYMISDKDNKSVTQWKKIED